MSHDICKFCSQATETMADNSLLLLVKCSSCDTYFSFDPISFEPRGIHIHFFINGKAFKYYANYQQPYMQVRALNPSNSAAHVMSADIVPNWTPQNIVEKVSNLLIFI